MSLKSFFNNRIKKEKALIKTNKEGFGAIGILEALMGGAFVMGTLSGIFTVPIFLAMTIPALVGIQTMSSLKKSIKDSKENIAHLENLEKNGVDVSRNHERHIKINELQEEKAKENKKNDKFTKVMLGGIGAFIAGGFFSLAAPLATALMVGGYGTMLYGMYKENESADKLREIQKDITKTSDLISAANVKQKFIMSEEEIDTQEKEKKAEKIAGQTKSYSKEKEAIVDKYVEDLSKEDSREDTNNKIR